MNPLSFMVQCEKCGAINLELGNNLLFTLHYEMCIFHFTLWRLIPGGIHWGRSPSGPPDRTPSCRWSDVASWCSGWSGHVQPGADRNIKYSRPSVIFPTVATCDMFLWHAASVKVDPAFSHCSAPQSILGQTLSMCKSPLQHAFVQTSPFLFIQYIKCGFKSNNSFIWAFGGVPDIQTSRDHY